MKYSMNFIQIEFVIITSVSCCLTKPFRSLFVVLFYALTFNIVLT